MARGENPLGAFCSELVSNPLFYKRSGDYKQVLYNDEEDIYKSMKEATYYDSFKKH